METWLAGLIPRLQAEVARFVNRHSAPGAVVGVVEDDRLAWGHGAGFTDLETATAPSASTCFRIASITKTFTATALVQLRDEGALSLDDPLAMHLPEFAGARNPFGAIESVTLRGLLTHRGGLPSEPPLQDWRAKRFPSVEETLAKADAIELAIPPNSAQKYSNLAYQLLGEVVQRAGGEPFPDRVGSHILAPLGMTSTGFAPPPGVSAATGFDASSFTDHPSASDPRDKPTEAEGGLWSSVGDLARWIGFQLSDGGDVLTRSSIDELLRPHVIEDEAWTRAQGLAWYHERRGDRVLIGHAGGTPGFRSRIAFTRPDRVGVIVLVNGEAPASAFALDLAELVVDARRSLPRPERLARPTPVPEAFVPYLGMYRWAGSGEVVRIEWRGAALVVAWVGEEAPHPRLEPAGSPDAFIIRGGRETGERAVFRRDGDDRIVGVDVASYPLERLEGPVR